MTRRGGGLALALFATLILCQPRSVPARDGPFPDISQMDRRDDAFRQYIADVEANRRLTFNLNRRQGITVATIAESLTIFSYTVREGDSLLSIAARSSIPFSALVSLNRLGSAADVRPGMTLLLPSAPGIFVPGEPASDLERLLASSRFPAYEEEWAAVVVPGAAGAGTVFSFFPGDDFSQPERAFFLNPGFFRFPLLNFRITSGYGMRSDPFGGHPHFHRGVDLAAPMGTEIFAAADGEVVETGFDRVLGYFVRIRHAGNWMSLYGHMQRIGIAVGTQVRAGTLIGWVGTTGVSTGPHLHFELWQGGQTRDPARYLRQ